MARAFRFRHAWRCAGEADRVLEALGDPAGYPRWWPQVREAERLDEDRARVVIRSVLPLPLVVTMTREVEDRGRGVLRATVTGDLTGWVDVRVVPEPQGCVVTWDQVATMDHPLLARVAGAPPARWVMRANHALMMRAARRALDAV